MGRKRTNEDKTKVCYYVTNEAVIAIELYAQRKGVSKTKAVDELIRKGLSKSIREWKKVNE